MAMTLGPLLTAVVITCCACAISEENRHTASSNENLASRPKAWVLGRLLERCRISSLRGICKIRIPRAGVAVTCVGVETHQGLIERLSQSRHEAFDREQTRTLRASLPYTCGKRPRLGSTP